jgi:phage baseplate assembly protein W
LSIKIKSLGASKLAGLSLDKGYLYKDVEFDLTPSVSFNSQLNRNETLKDIQALYDLEAIKNSIVNCFLTAPGQKILSPLFGIDLRQFLFEGIDDFTSDIIQETIERKLPRMEPRIKVSNVTVIADEDANQYNITLKIDVPSLDIYGVSIRSELNSIGYTIV